MTYLCFKSQNTNSNVAAANNNVGGNDNNTTSSVTTISCVELGNNNLSHDSIVLPTFTATVNNDGMKAEIRAVKDGGSQLSFISRPVAEALKLPIIKSGAPLTVHGFNSSRTMHTDSVKLKLTVGDQTYSHTAVCVDKIPTNFNAHGIGKVVDAFRSLGYKLADKDYESGESETVTNIDFILGSDGDHILPITNIIYGDPTNTNANSCFFKSPAGAIFTGRVSNMIANINFIPKLSSNSNIKKFNSPKHTQAGCMKFSSRNSPRNYYVGSAITDQTKTLRDNSMATSTFYRLGRHPCRNFSGYSRPSQPFKANWHANRYNMGRHPNFSHPSMYMRPQYDFGCNQNSYHYMMTYGYMHGIPPPFWWNQSLF